MASASHPRTAGDPPRVDRAIVHSLGPGMCRGTDRPLIVSIALDSVPDAADDNVVILAAHGFRIQADAGDGSHGQPHRERHMSRSRLLVRIAATAALMSGGALIPLCATAAAASGPAYVSDPASLVNPLIGTTNGGDVFPGADQPFGMIQWSPDTPSRPSGGGYEYTDKAITGYSLTHISGPGCGAADDVPILPTTGAVGANPSSTTEPLDHSQETASPGYYQLNAGGVNTQLSTTLRAGIARFGFPSSSATGNLLFKLSDSGAPDTATHFQVVSDKEISGWVTTGAFCGATNQYTLHFDMVFNRPFTNYGTWTNGSTPQAGARSMTTRLTPAEKAAAQKQAKLQGLKALSTDGLAGSRTSTNGRLRAHAGSASAQGAQPPVTGADGAYISFATGTTSTVQAKVGISYVSTANASQNATREIPNWNFHTVRTTARSAWNQALSKIQVAGGTTNQQTVFYTALYHSLLHPNVDSDDNGQYTGFDGQVHTTPTSHPIYANYSGWDIYRSQSPLEAMLFPRQMSDTVTSMLADYNQTGELPKWSEDNGESYVMVGDPSDPIISDAYAFGARGFKTGQALTDMQTEASVPGNIRPGLSDYLDQGYLPIDGNYGCCNYYGPVSTQEEYNAADSSIASFASSLGNTSVAGTFATRANNWQNVYNPGTGFLQPKLADGSFQSGFDPTSSTGFVEADAYVYAAELPFDVAGLASAEGGAVNWQKFLDGLTSSVTQMGATQAQLGNEPSFDIPWEYDYVGQPYKAQEVVRQVQDALYTNTPGGLAGNDDLGAMSSWYVFSALGGYPESPGSANLALGSPEFTNIAIHLGNGKTITESAPQAADGSPYVQSVSVDGSSWDKDLPAGQPDRQRRHGGLDAWLHAVDDVGQCPQGRPAVGHLGDAAGAGLRERRGQLAAAGGQPRELDDADARRAVDDQGLADRQLDGERDLGLGAAGRPDQRLDHRRLREAGHPAGRGDGARRHARRALPGHVPPALGDGHGVARRRRGRRRGQPGRPVAVLQRHRDLLGHRPGSRQLRQRRFQLLRAGARRPGRVAGRPLTADGVQYAFPSAAVGTPDNVIAGGQTIKLLPVSGASKIGILGAATNGPSTGQMTITYTDGSSQQAALGFSDWTLNANSSSPSYGNTEVAQTPYRNTTAGTSQTVNTYLLSTSVPITAGKTVASVTLPSSTNQGSLHVFAIGSDAGPLTR